MKLTRKEEPTNQLHINTGDGESDKTESPKERFEPKMKIATP